MTVKIDRYVIDSESSPKVLIKDMLYGRYIANVNTNNREHNLRLASILLDELNTGDYSEE